MVSSYGSWRGCHLKTVCGGGKAPQGDNREADPEQGAGKTPTHISTALPEQPERGRGAGRRVQGSALPYWLPKATLEAVGPVRAYLTDGCHADVAQIQGVNSFQFHSLLKPTTFRVDSSNLKGMGQLGNLGGPDGGWGELASSGRLGRKQGGRGTPRGREAWRTP